MVSRSSQIGVLSVIFIVCSQLMNIATGVAADVNPRTIRAQHGQIMGDNHVAEKRMERQSGGLLFSIIQPQPQAITIDL